MTVAAGCRRLVFVLGCAAGLVPTDSLVEVAVHPAGNAQRLMNPQPVFRVVSPTSPVALPPGTTASLTVLSGPGLLSGTLTIPFENENAFPFTNLEINTPGTYNLQFLATTPASVSFRKALSLNVANAVPTQVILATDEGMYGFIGGQLFPQPVLFLADSSGVATMDAGLSAFCVVEPVSPLVALIGQNNSTVSADGVTFTYVGLRMDTLGQHQLNATATLTSGVQLSTVFSVTVDQAQRLPVSAVLETTPRAAAQADFATPISILLVDSAGGPVPNDARATLSVVSAPAGGGLTGAVTAGADVSKARITFPAVQATAAGRYVVLASVTLSSGTVLTASLPFEVTPQDPEPACICILQQGVGRSGVVLAQQPILAMASACLGSSCADLMASPNATLYLSLASGPGNGTMTGETLVTSDAQGRFLFRNLAFAAPGVYLLTASVRLATGTLLPDFGFVLHLAVNLEPAVIAIATSPRATAAGAVLLPALEVELIAVDGAPAADDGASVACFLTRAPAGPPAALAGSTLAVRVDETSDARYRFESLAISAAGVHVLEISAVLSTGDVLYTTVAVTVSPAYRRPPRGLLPEPSPTVSVAGVGGGVPLLAEPRFAFVDILGEPVNSSAGALCTLSNTTVEFEDGGPADPSTGRLVPVAPLALQAASRFALPALAADAPGVYRLSVACAMADGATVVTGADTLRTQERPAAGGHGTAAKMMRAAVVFVGLLLLLSYALLRILARSGVPVATLLAGGTKPASGDTALPPRKRSGGFALFEGGGNVSVAAQTDAAVMLRIAGAGGDPRAQADEMLKALVRCVDGSGESAPLKRQLLFALLHADVCAAADEELGGSEGSASTFGGIDVQTRGTARSHESLATTPYAGPGDAPSSAGGGPQPDSSDANSSRRPSTVQFAENREASTSSPRHPNGRPRHPFAPGASAGCNISDRDADEDAASYTNEMDDLLGRCVGGPRAAGSGERDPDGGVQCRRESTLPLKQKRDMREAIRELDLLEQRALERAGTTSPPGRFPRGGVAQAQPYAARPYDTLFKGPSLARYGFPDALPQAKPKPAAHPIPPAGYVLPGGMSPARYHTPTAFQTPPFGTPAPSSVKSGNRTVPAPQLLPGGHETPARPAPHPLLSNGNAEDPLPAASPPYYDHAAGFGQPPQRWFRGRGNDATDFQAGYSGRGDATGFQAGYSGRGDATGFQAGYSGRGDATGFQAGFSGRGDATGLQAGHPGSGGSGEATPGPGPKEEEDGAEEEIIFWKHALARAESGTPRRPREAAESLAAPPGGSSQPPPAPASDAAPELSVEPGYQLLPEEQRRKIAAFAAASVAQRQDERARREAGAGTRAAGPAFSGAAIAAAVQKQDDVLAQLVAKVDGVTSAVTELRSRDKDREPPPAPPPPPRKASQDGANDSHLTLMSAASAAHGPPSTSSTLGVNCSDNPHVITVTSPSSIATEAPPFPGSHYRVLKTPRDLSATVSSVSDETVTNSSVKTQLPAAELRKKKKPTQLKALMRPSGERDRTRELIHEQLLS